MIRVNSIVRFVLLISGLLEGRGLTKPSFGLKKHKNKRKLLVEDATTLFILSIHAIYFEHV